MTILAAGSDISMWMCHPSEISVETPSLFERREVSGSKHQPPGLAFRATGSEVHSDMERIRELKYLSTWKGSRRSYGDRDTSMWMCQPSEIAVETPSLFGRRRYLKARGSKRQPRATGSEEPSDDMERIPDSKYHHPFQMTHVAAASKRPYVEVSTWNCQPSEIAFEVPPYVEVSTWNCRPAETPIVVPCVYKRRRRCLKATVSKQQPPEMAFRATGSEVPSDLERNTALPK